MRDKGLAPNTIKQTHSILSAALRVAVDEQLITRNPATVKSVQVSTEKNPHDIVQPTDAIKIVDAATSADERARLMAALWLGMRQSEALALDWDHVHEDADWPHVEIVRAARTVKGEGLVLTEPKSSTSKRVTPMSPAVAAAFRVWRAESGGEGFVWPNTTGGIMSPRRDAERWALALARAGVPHVPLHGARGTAATIMLMDTPLHVVARYLGHSNPTVTLQHYARAMDDQLSAAADALERRMLANE